MVKVLFLTNNDNTKPLYQWLCQDEKVIYCEEKISLSDILYLEIDWIVSYNYKYIISKEIINYFPNRIINLHMSLLPWNRGSFPNFWSFIEDTPKGVSILHINEGVDTGDIIASNSFTFDETQESFKSSYDKLNFELQELFKSKWAIIKNLEIEPIKQLEAGSFHKDADFYSFIEEYPDFNWDTNISEFKIKIGIYNEKNSY